MLTGVLLVWTVALAWLLTCGGVMPRAIGPGVGLDRRLRWVARHPGAANTGDIERMLLRHGLSVTDVRLVTNRAFSLGIRSLTLWMWIRVYGARELAVAVAGDLPHEELLEHLREGTVPDFHELEIFAALNGLEAATRNGGETRGRTPDLRPTASRRLPPGWDSFFDDLAS